MRDSLEASWQTPVESMNPLAVAVDASQETRSGLGAVAVDRRARWVRGIVGTAAFAAGLYVYTVVQDLATPRTTFETALDANIPFVPELMLAYLLFFPFVALAAFATSRDNFARVVVACLIAASTGWLCFLLAPASMTRPDPASIHDPAIRTLFVLLHAVDDSHNTFPSLHVAVTWICCAAFLGTRWFWLAAPAAFLISVSTLFVKQHTVIDVAGGTLLALLSFAMAKALTSRFAKQRLLRSPLAIRNRLRR